MPSPRKTEQWHFTQKQGIKVVTYDADSMPDSRSFFVNQATPEGIGHALMDDAARLLNNEGEFAMITASLTAANQREWQKHIEARLKAKYPKMKLVAVRPCDDLKDKAQSEATALMSANPNLKLIMAICSRAVPGAAEAVKQAGKTAVKVMASASRMKPPLRARGRNRQRDPFEHRRSHTTT